MLITFQSKAAPDVTMLKDLAGYLLGLVGKRLDVRGVITQSNCLSPSNALKLRSSTTKNLPQKMTLSIVRCTRIVASIARDFHSRPTRF